MDLLFSVVGIIITIFFVIGFHEFAHFIAARLLNIKVLKFSIGFGKALFRFHDKKNTEYVIALVPLGGYVKLLGETEETDPKDSKYAFNTQPFYKKFLVLAAGPFANLLSAFILYWIIFIVGFSSIKPIIGEISPQSIAARSGLQGQQEILSVDNDPSPSWMAVMLRIAAHVGNQDQLQIETQSLSTHQKQIFILNLADWTLDNQLKPDLLASLGIVPYEPTVPPVIGIIKENSPAARSSLRVGDRILKINSQAIQNWHQLVNFVQEHPDQTVTFTIARQGKTINHSVYIGYKKAFLINKTGYLAMGPQFIFPKHLLRQFKYGPLDAIPHAFKEMTNFIYFNFILFGKLLTGKMSLESLGGPITIFETAGTTLEYGLISFIGFLAFLSISIGIINILPIPGLDGGNICIYFIEFLIRRPIPEKILFIAYQGGILLIAFVMIRAILNDVLRLY